MGSSILLRIIGVARGDKSSGNYRRVRSTDVWVSKGQNKEGKLTSTRDDSNDMPSLTTRTTFLTSSSVAFLKSWSNGLASSLKSPTSSQFFKKRVGVGVWSAKLENL